MDQPTVLPQELRLVSPVTIPQARSYIFPIPSMDSMYDLTANPQDVQIDIPRLQRSYLSKDSYLGFTLSVDWTPGETAGGGVGPNFSICLDTPGAYGLFDAIEVYDYLGSTLLERINGHAELMSLLIDADPMAYGHPTTNGTRPFVAANADNPPYTQYNPAVTGPFSGDVFHSNGVANATTVVTRSKQYAIPIASFIGFLSKKMVPLHNGYTLILKWNTAQNALGLTPLGDPATTADIKSQFKAARVSDVKFFAQVLELGPVAEGLLQASTNGEPMIVPTRTYRNYSTVWKKSNVFVERSLDINLNVASMTGVLWMMRETTQVDNINNRKYQRIRNYLQSWALHYGSSVLPHSSGIETQNIDTNSFSSGAQGYNELIKALRCQKKHTNFSQNSWNFDTSTGYDGTLLCPFLDVDYGNSRLNTYEYGRFACGLNTQLIPDKDNISGLNTNGIATQLRARFNPHVTNQTNVGTQASEAVIVDAFVEYDAFVTIVPGIATSVTF